MLRNEINNRQGKVIFTTNFLHPSIVFSERKFLVLSKWPKNNIRSIGIIWQKICKMLLTMTSSSLGIDN
jgi:hypothetical protein